MKSKEHHIFSESEVQTPNGSYEIAVDERTGGLVFKNPLKVLNDADKKSNGSR